MSGRPVVALFTGPVALRSVDEGPIVRALESLPSGSVLLDRDRPGVERFARLQAVERGIHVGTLRRDHATSAALALHDDAVFRLRPEVVYAHRQGDEDTARVVALARAADADVRSLGVGEGCTWADAGLTSARAAEARRRWASLSVALFSGSRKWRDIERVEAGMGQLPERSLVIEGDAPGLDRIAAAVGRLSGFPVLSVPALWDFHDKAAGYRRNEAMARLAPDRLLAYPLDGPGTASMVELAESLCISVEVAERLPAKFRGRLARVVHCQREEYDIYIGRGRDPRTGEVGRWGNRYSHRPSRVPGVVQVASAEEAVVRYRRDLAAAVRSGRIELSRLAALHGQRLGCYCAPYCCHGEVLASAAAWAYWAIEASGKEC